MSFEGLSSKGSPSGRQLLPGALALEAPEEARRGSPVEGGDGVGGKEKWTPKKYPPKNEAPMLGKRR